MFAKLPLKIAKKEGYLYNARIYDFKEFLPSVITDFR